METLTIGKLAKRAGVSTDTIRFYERCGLIETAARSASNYRLYNEEDALRLRFIRRAKSLGFTLAEIGELLLLSGDSAATKADIKQRAMRKIEKIRARIRDLNRIQAGLEQLVAQCDGHGPVDDCPILEALGGDRPLHHGPDSH
ncbi:heavy metal-responsive transcriptional regulator [Thermodesulfobacteriota bacterium B35]